LAHDVFISYASKDKVVADAVCAALEADHIRCYIAPRDVLPGQRYAQALVDAIHASRVFVLVFSAASNASNQVEREVDRAVSCGLPILPLRVEDVMPCDWLEYYLAGQHWLDALTPPLEDHLARLSEAISVLLQPAAKGARTPLKDEWRAAAPPTPKAAPSPPGAATAPPVASKPPAAAPADTPEAAAPPPPVVGKAPPARRPTEYVPPRPPVQPAEPVRPPSVAAHVTAKEAEAAKPTATGAAAKPTATGAVAKPTPAGAPAKPTPAPTAEKPAPTATKPTPTAAKPTPTAAKPAPTAAKPAATPPAAALETAPKATAKAAAPARPGRRTALIAAAVVGVAWVGVLLAVELLFR